MLSLNTIDGRRMEIKEESDLKSVEIGAILEFLSHPLYTHWAVYIGNGNICHFNAAYGEGSSGVLKNMADSDGRVSIDNFWDIKRQSGVDVYVNDFYDKHWKALPKDDIVKRAKEYNGKCMRYNAAGFNCEHFATLCRYNKMRSEQVETTKKILASVSIKVENMVASALGRVLSTQ